MTGWLSYNWVVKMTWASENVAELQAVSASVLIETSVSSRQHG